MLVDLLTYMLDGQAECTMHVCFQIQVCTTEGRATLFPDLKESISGKDIALVLLGDPAYPLLHWMMKAFPDNGRLSCEQKLFNYRLSKARIVVEHSYGRLKGRWRSRFVKETGC